MSVFLTSSSRSYNQRVENGAFESFPAVLLPSSVPSSGSLEKPQQNLSSNNDGLGSRQRSKNVLDETGGGGSEGSRLAQDDQQDVFVGSDAGNYTIKFINITLVQHKFQQNKVQCSKDCCFQSIFPFLWQCTLRIYVHFYSVEIYSPIYQVIYQTFLLARTTGIPPLAIGLHTQSVCSQTHKIVFMVVLKYFSSQTHLISTSWKNLRLCLASCVHLAGNISVDHVTFSEIRLLRAKHFFWNDNLMPLLFI